MVICFDQPTVRIDHGWERNQQILSSERLTAVGFGDIFVFKDDLTRLILISLAANTFSVNMLLD